MKDRLTHGDIDTNTYFSEQMYKSIKEKLQKYESDNEKEIRLKSRLCKTCFYLRRNTLAGQAFTKSTCRNCEKEIINPTTNTSKICDVCSDKLNICVKCGGRI